jgi:NADH-quinone oxidoreductase subunit G
MTRIFLNDREVEVAKDATVLRAALDNGVYIPTFCWHPALSVAGNCRICMVEVEGKGLDIACNMPVSEGMKVYTESDDVKAARKAMMQFITLNHPVDCGICDKAGECALQDAHFAYNGEPSVSREPKTHATKLHELGPRILIDNERCILCSRCVRFTAEVTKTHALGMVQRGDHAIVRGVEGKPFDEPYSDNVVDLCPVGALLSRDFFYKARVWFLEATPSVCPGCARGCTVKLWHRRPDWKLCALDGRHNTSILRVTPLENGAVDGAWICNKGRDLARIFERPRSAEAMRKGAVVPLDDAIAEAAMLIASAKKPVALVSSWGSDEELAAFEERLGARFTSFVKADHAPQPGEVVEDALLIRADKNPNTRGAQARFGGAPIAFPAGTDLVLVWGEGFDFARLPSGAKAILLGAALLPENGGADVFLPLTLQTERAGHYTSFDGAVKEFRPCFAPPKTAIDAAALFARLGVRP